MQKKTASASPNSQKASRPQDPGLIAKPTQRSAGRSRGLDDRSHRTRRREVPKGTKPGIPTVTRTAGTLFWVTSGRGSGVLGSFAWPESGWM